MIHTNKHLVMVDRSPLNGKRRVRLREGQPSVVSGWVGGEA